MTVPSRELAAEDVAHDRPRREAPAGRALLVVLAAERVELGGVVLLGVGPQDGGGLGSGGHRDPSSAAKAALMRLRKSINSRYSLRIGYVPSRLAIAGDDGFQLLSVFGWEAPDGHPDKIDERLGNTDPRPLARESI